MKNRLWLAAGVLGLLAFAAFADTDINWGAKNRKTVLGDATPVPAVQVKVVGGINPSDTSGVPFQFASDGSQKVSETFKDRDNWRLYPNIINNQLTASSTGMVDSCQAQDTHDMKKLWLVLYGQFDSLSTVVRLAVQVRAHYNTLSDSGSAYPWVRWPIPRPATPISVASVLGSNTGAALHLAAAAGSRGGFSQVPNGYQVCGPGVVPGTYVVSHNTSDSGIVISNAVSFDQSATYTFYPPGTLQPTNSAQSDSIGDTIIGSGSLAQVTEANSVAGSSGMWPGEFMAKFNITQRDTVVSSAGKYGGAPYGMWIPLQDYQGVPFQAPYTSVRVRVINGIRSRFRIRVDLVGSSL